MFWRKKGTEHKSSKKRKSRVDLISGSVLWPYMIKQYGLTPDDLLDLRRVESDGVVGGEPVVMIRIFDPASANKNGVTIDDYDGLDSHPELILYEGYYREVGGPLKTLATDIQIEKK